MKPCRATVVYIAGSGRSGSTLLERLIGEVDGYTNVGELIDLFRRVFAGDESCGCGEPFSVCPFWGEVGERMWVGGWSAEKVAHVARLQASVARQRYIPHQLAGALAPPSFRRRSNEYRRVYTDLYAAIQDVSGANAVVDASKWPAQALAVSNPELDLRVIHLVRDVRGVAASLSRTNVARPQSTGGDEVMYSQDPYRAAASWMTCQTEAELLRKRAQVVRVRYEDLLADPRRTLERTLRRLGLDIPSTALSHVTGANAELRRSHGLSGNPSRFQVGTIHLHLDEKWRGTMPRKQQLLLSPLDRIYRRETTSEDE